MSAVELLQAAAAANMISLVRDALRYQYLRDKSTTIESVRMLQEHADTYLDAEIDRCISEQTYALAEAEA